MTEPTCRMSYPADGAATGRIDDTSERATAHLGVARPIDIRAWAENATTYTDALERADYPPTVPCAHRPFPTFATLGEVSENTDA